MLLQVAGFPSFLRLNNIPLCVCVCVCVCDNFFIHSSTNTHLGCVHILAVVNNTAMNIKDYLQDSDFISFAYMPRRWIAGSYDRYMFNYF